MGIDIDANGNAGQLAVTQSVRLAGSLTVTRNVNWKPTSGTVTFLTFNGNNNTDFASETIRNNSWTVNNVTYSYGFNPIGATSYNITVQGGGGAAPRRLMQAAAPSAALGVATGTAPLTPDAIATDLYFATVSEYLPRLLDAYAANARGWASVEA